MLNRVRAAVRPERVNSLVKRALDAGDRSRGIYPALGELAGRWRATGTVPGLTAHELRVFSQNGEDGVLAEIFGRIGVAGGGFVEFGASDGAENNAAFLAQVLGWPGVFLEADPGAFSALEHRYRGPPGGADRPGRRRAGHGRGAAARRGRAGGARPARDRRRRQRLLDLACAGGVPPARRGDRVQRRPRPDGAEGHAATPRAGAGTTRAATERRWRRSRRSARARATGSCTPSSRASTRSSCAPTSRARCPPATRFHAAAPVTRCSVTATRRRDTSPSGGPGREGARLPGAGLAAGDRGTVGLLLPRGRLLRARLHAGQPDRALRRADGRRRDDLLPPVGLPALPAVRAGAPPVPPAAAADPVCVAPDIADRARLLGGADARDGRARAPGRVHAHRHPDVLRLPADLLRGYGVQGPRPVLDAVRGGLLLRLPAAVGLVRAAHRARPLVALRSCGCSAGSSPRACSTRRSCSAGSRRRSCRSSSRFLLALPGFVDHFALGMGLAVLVVGWEERGALPGRGHARAAAVVGGRGGRLPRGVDAVGARRDTGPAVARRVRRSATPPTGWSRCCCSCPPWPGAGFRDAMLGWSPLRWLGTISYGIFLFHLPFLQLLSDEGLTRWESWLHPYLLWSIVGLTGTIVLATACWFAVERPALRLKPLAGPWRPPAARPARSWRAGARPERAPEG